MKLTKQNIQVGLWIKTAEGRLAQIIQVDKEPRQHYPNELRFTYKIYRGHNCIDSAGMNNASRHVILSKWEVFKLKAAHKSNYQKLGVMYQKSKRMKYDKVFLLAMSLLILGALSMRLSPYLFIDSQDLAIMEGTAQGGSYPLLWQKYGKIYAVCISVSMTIMLEGIILCFDRLFKNLFK